MAGAATWAFLLALAPAFAGAEVVDATGAGFTSRTTRVIAAGPADVYRALVGDIGRWWNPDHTYSGNAANLSLDDRAGGLFLEKLDSGGEVSHLTVVFADPGKTLRLAGGLGPLQALGVTGAMTWQLQPDISGTRVELTYVVGGYAPGGLEALASPVDQVVGEQLGRLQAYLERGR